MEMITNGFSINVISHGLSFSASSLTHQNEAVQGISHWSRDANLPETREKDMLIIRAVQRT
jgi:hypothetical protein